MAVPVLHILLTVFQSILQVFLLCLAGFVLSFKGIVDKPTSKALNHVNIALFTPALLFSKVAYFLSPAKLRQLWVIPVFFVLLTGTSALVAHCLARACRLKRTQVNFATAASMFMNSNSLPVALMQSLATTVPLLKRGPDDTFNAMFSRSLTYLVVFSTLGMILRWSYGVRLLSQADEPESPPIPTTFRDVDDAQPAAVDTSSAALVEYEEHDTRPRDRHMWHTHPFRSRPPPRLTPLARHHSHPHSRLPAVPTSLGDQSESDDTDELDTTEGDSEDTIALRAEAIDTGCSTEVEHHAPTPTPRWDRPARPSFSKRFLSTLTSLSPPLIASLSALFCVLIPPLQRLLKSDAMTPFKGALDNAGACSVPLTLLVLGGWFWGGESVPKRTPKDAETRDKPESHGQAHAKRKGKAVEKRHVPHHVLASDSRDSSTASLSSLIGTFGDVLMGRIHSRRGVAQMKRQARSATVVGDVEPGLLATHAETEIEHVENGLGRGSRLRTDVIVNGRAQPSPISPSSSSPSANPPGETLTVIITLLARMIIVPVVVTPIMVLVSRLGWGGEVFTDPVFIVSSMLLSASPPALSLAQISQRIQVAHAHANADGNAFSPFERLLSRTVFWAYLVLTPPIMIVSVMLGLLLIGA